MSLQWKICGMRNLDNIQDVLANNPDFMGFIFYEKSSRFVSDAAMDEIITLPFGTTERVGVFVNASYEAIKVKYEKGYFSYVQLHGDESPALVQRLKNDGIKTIKVFSVGEDFDVTVTTPYEEVADYFLFDTKGKHRGGNGVKFDWSVLESLNGNMPIILSGGLDVEDIGTLKQTTLHNLKMLDFNSKLELEPGLKQVDRIKELSKEINN